MLGFHAEIDAAMRLEHVEFLERALVQKQFDAFARRQLALLVLGLDAPLAAAKPRRRTPAFQLAQDVFHGISSENFRATYRNERLLPSGFGKICK